MKTPLDPDTAKLRVVRKYHKLYKPLIELIDALQNLEPNGILVDNATITKEEEGSNIRVVYAARPLSLMIVDGKRVFTLRMSDEIES